MGRDLFWHLRRTKLDHLLMLIANAMRGMFDRNQPVESLDTVRLDGIFPKKGKVTVTAWSLSDLAYLAMRESHDFHTEKASVHDLVALCNLFIEWDNQRSGEELVSLTGDDLILKFAVGFSQKQFWYQEIYRLRQEFNRQVELLEVIPGEVADSVDLEGACLAKTGFGLRTLRALLFTLLAIAGKQTDISQITSSTATTLHPALTAQNIRKVAELYAGDYEEFRRSPLAENHFYLKPVVRTSSNRLIAVNAYMFAKKAADGPFWAVREYFRERGRQDFVNAFGLYFDRYVEKLFQRMLPPNRFARVIPRGREKCADWILHTSRYRIILELKSSIAALMMRRLYPDIQNIQDYLKKFQEGVVQLDSTTQSYPEISRTTIRLLVYYETLYVSDGALRSFVVHEITPKLVSTEHIYFCDIGELEWFVSVLAASETTAENILDAKISAEASPASGRDLGQIIPSITSMPNSYMLEVLDHWNGYVRP